MLSEYADKIGNNKLIPVLVLVMVLTVGVVGVVAVTDDVGEAPIEASENTLQDDVELSESNESHTVEGTVTDDGEPVYGATVEIKDSTGSVVETVFTDIDGEFNSSEHDSELSISVTVFDEDAVDVSVDTDADKELFVIDYTVDVEDYGLPPEDEVVDEYWRNVDDIVEPDVINVIRDDTWGYQATINNGFGFLLNDNEVHENATLVIQLPDEYNINNSYKVNHDLGPTLIENDGMETVTRLNEYEYNTTSNTFEVDLGAHKDDFNNIDEHRTIRFDDLTLLRDTQIYFELDTGETGEYGVHTTDIYQDSSFDIDEFDTPEN